MEGQDEVFMGNTHWVHIGQLCSLGLRWLKHGSNALGSSSSRWDGMVDTGEKILSHYAQFQWRKVGGAFN